MAGAIHRSVGVSIGEVALALRTLDYTRQGVRENSAFAYALSWLESPLRFAVSPDLPLTTARQFKKAVGAEASFRSQGLLMQLAN